MATTTTTITTPKATAPAPASRFGGNSSRRDEFGFGSLRDGLADDIGGAVVGAALGFAGRALAKRMKKAYEEKIAPAMEARAAQAQQQSQQRWSIRPTRTRSCSAIPSCAAAWPTG